MKTTYKYTLGQQFTSAIVNGDYSGLSDSEENQLNEFIESLPNQYHYKTKQHKNFDMVDYEQESRLDHCEITGLLGDCVDFELSYT